MIKKTRLKNLTGDMTGKWRKRSKDTSCGEVKKTPKTKAYDEYRKRRVKEATVKLQKSRRERMKRKRGTSV